MTIKKGYAALETNAIQKCPQCLLTMPGNLIRSLRNKVASVELIIESQTSTPGAFRGRCSETDLRLFFVNGDPICPTPTHQYLYVTEDEKKRDQKPEKKDREKPQKERYLLCKHCENKITRPDDRLNFQGAFDHTFLNPSGSVYRIGCFYKADGCIVLGEASTEWTWFQGFHWRVAVCSQCLKHLGWFYTNKEESSFFGLILDALV